MISIAVSSSSPARLRGDAKAAVHAVTSEFARDGGGVLMISSDLPEILGMSDRVLVMRRGRLRGEFTREQATSETLLRAASDA